MDNHGEWACVEAAGRKSASQKSGSLWEGLAHKHVSDKMLVDGKEFGREVCSQKRKALIPRCTKCGLL